MNTVPHSQDGDHDEDACQRCIEDAQTISGGCRCGECCRLLVQATLADAVREPRIAECGLPVVTDFPNPVTGENELVGYYLPHADGRCVFLDWATHDCTIYDTRPGECRVFDCRDKSKLIGLGILKRRDSGGDMESSKEDYERAINRAIEDQLGINLEHAIRYGVAYPKEPTAEERMRSQRQARLQIVADIENTRIM